jgi:hypothetical protein
LSTPGLLLLQEPPAAHCCQAPSLGYPGLIYVHQSFLQDTITIPLYCRYANTSEPWQPWTFSHFSTQVAQHANYQVLGKLRLVQPMETSPRLPRQQIQPHHQSLAGLGLVLRTEITSRAPPGMLRSCRLHHTNWVGTQTSHSLIRVQCWSSEIWRVDHRCGNHSVILSNVRMAMP